MTVCGVVSGQTYRGSSWALRGTSRGRWSRGALLGCALGLLLAGVTRGTEPTVALQMDWADWLEHYYARQYVNDTSSAIEFFAVSGALANPVIAARVLGFLSLQFKSHPDKVAGWVTDLKRLPGGRDVLIAALWYAGQTELARSVARDEGWSQERLRALEAPPPDPLKMPVSQIETVEMMWGAFYQSGDVRFVRRVLDVLDSPSSARPDALIWKALRNAARSSLKERVSKHDVILKLCTDEAAKRGRETREFLAGITTERPKASKALPTKDGPLYATVIPSDDPGFLRKWMAASLERRQELKPTARVGRMHPVAIYVVFHGFELDPSRRAQVDYDLEITRPDGKSYLSQPGLPGILGVQPAGTSEAINNMQGAALFFDPPDPVGSYSVAVEVHDRIGHRNVRAAAPLELKD